MSATTLHGSSIHSMQRILVVGPSWVGDMVMAQALFRQLRTQSPGVEIDVLAPDWSRPLLERMPEVTRALDLPFGHGELSLGKRYALGKKLRKQAYDQAIVLPNSFKSALLPMFAGIKLRTGWRGEMRGGLLNDCRRLDKSALPMMVQRFLALALPKAAQLPSELPDPIPVPSLLVDPVASAQTRLEFGIAEKIRMLALCPGAEFGHSKQWPAEHYAAVALACLSDGWQVCLFGSANDCDVANQIAELLPAEHRAACHNLAGRTTLGQAIDLLSTATAVVSNDSGLMHIAAALHRPLVAVYGPTSPEFTPPLSDRVELLYTDISCRPCFKRQCPYGHKRCLTALLPEQVISALKRLQNPLVVG
jgi:heptosyltransferase II